MVRFSAPSISLMSGLDFMRARSCGGGSGTKSTWPEMSAAERVAADLMGVNTTSSMLPVGLSHQFGFFLSVTFTSGCQPTMMKGPVPLALREA